MFDLRPKSGFSTSTLPVTQEELLAFLQVDASEWQTVVLPLLRSAMSQVEEQTKKALFLREWELLTDCLHDMYILPGCYVTEVMEIKSDGEEVDSDSYDLVGDYLLLYSSFPVALRYYSVSYKRGFSPDTLPENVKQALKVLVREWYDNRGDSARNWPTLVDKLLMDYKTHKA